MFESKKQLRKLLIEMHKMTEVIIARGGKLEMITTLLTKLPVNLATFLFQKMGSEKTLTGQIMLVIEDEEHPIAAENKAFAEDVWKSIV